MVLRSWVFTVTLVTAVTLSITGEGVNSETNSLMLVYPEQESRHIEKREEGMTSTTPGSANNAENVADMNASGGNTTVNVNSTHDMANTTAGGNHINITLETCVNATLSADKGNSSKALQRDTVTQVNGTENTSLPLENSNTTTIILKKENNTDEDVNPDETLEGQSSSPAVNTSQAVLEENASETKVDVLAVPPIKNESTRLRNHEQNVTRTDSVGNASSVQKDNILMTLLRNRRAVEEIENQSVSTSIQSNNSMSSTENEEVSPERKQDTREKATEQNNTSLMTAKENDTNENLKDKNTADDAKDNNNTLIIAEQANESAKDSLSENANRETVSSNDTKESVGAPTESENSTNSAKVDENLAKSEIKESGLSKTEEGKIPAIITSNITTAIESKNTSVPKIQSNAMSNRTEESVGIQTAVEMFSSEEAKESNVTTSDIRNVTIAAKTDSPNLNISSNTSREIDQMGFVENRSSAVLKESNDSVSTERSEAFGTGTDNVKANTTSNKSGESLDMDVLEETPSSTDAETGVKGEANSLMKVDPEQENRHIEKREERTSSTTPDSGNNAENVANMNASDGNTTVNVNSTNDMSNITAGENLINITVKKGVNATLSADKGNSSKPLQRDIVTQTNETENTSHSLEMSNTTTMNLKKENNTDEDVKFGEKIEAHQSLPAVNTSQAITAANASETNISVPVASPIETEKKILGNPEENVTRTDSDGNASSVQKDNILMTLLRNRRATEDIGNQSNSTSKQGNNSMPSTEKEYVFPEMKKDTIAKAMEQSNTSLMMAKENATAGNLKNENTADISKDNNNAVIIAEQTPESVKKDNSYTNANRETVTSNDTKESVGEPNEPENITTSVKVDGNLTKAGINGSGLSNTEERNQSISTSIQGNNGMPSSEKEDVSPEMRQDTIEKSTEQSNLLLAKENDTNKNLKDESTADIVKDNKNALIIAEQEPESVEKDSLSSNANRETVSSDDTKESVGAPNEPENITTSVKVDGNLTKLENKGSDFSKTEGDIPAMITSNITTAKESKNTSLPESKSISMSNAKEENVGTGTVVEIISLEETRESNAMTAEERNDAKAAKTDSSNSNMSSNTSKGIVQTVIVLEILSSAEAKERNKLVSGERGETFRIGTDNVKANAPLYNSGESLDMDLLQETPSSTEFEIGGVADLAEIIGHTNTESTVKTTESTVGTTESTVETTESTVGTTESTESTTESTVGTTESTVGTTESTVGTTESDESDNSKMLYFETEY